MRPRLPALIAVPAVALAVAACSTAASPGTPAPASPAAAPATVPPPQSATAAPAPARYSANITIAPADGALTGPEKLTFTSCGKLTPAQQSQFGTDAAGGLTYKFTNQAAFAADPQVAVNFLQGTTVVASNVTGPGTPVGTGQSASGEVDAVGASGQPVKFTSCEVMDYLLLSAAGSVPVQYAG